MIPKAQTQVITIVLISGIVISLLGTAYMWGIPLITKRTSITEFLSAEDFVVKLDQKIIDISASESGETTLDMPDGLIRVYSYDALDPLNNSLIFEFVTDQPLSTTNSNVILKTSILGDNATYGEAEPRIMSMSTGSYATGSKISLRLRYRELDTTTQPFRGYQISLVAGSISGTEQVILSYAGTEVNPGGKKAMNGGDLFLTKIKVDAV